MRVAQIGINSVSTGGASLEERLAAYAKAGFKLVEFQLGQVHEYLAQGHTAADARALLEQHGQHCLGGFETNVVCFGDDAAKKENHDRIELNARLIQELGGKNMVVGTDGPSDPAMPYDQVLSQMASVFAQVAKRIKPTGVSLCIEFNWGPAVKTLTMAAAIARKSKASNVGVIFDPAHYYCTPTKFEELTRANVAMIKHVHINDMPKRPAEYCNKNNDRVLPGKGGLDLKNIIRTLERLGYKGNYSIEMFSKELREMPVATASKLMYQSMAKLAQK